MRRSLIALLSLLIALGSSAALAQRPGHGGTTSDVEEGTPVAAVDCSLVSDYMDDLNEVFNRTGPFTAFIFSDTEFESLNPGEAQEIVDDGGEILALLADVTVPAPYQPGHDGLILYLQNLIDFTRFYALDSSSVPDIYAYDDAMTGIYRGEVDIAEACPDEIEAIGGYIFMDPATLEEEYGDAE